MPFNDNQVRESTWQAGFLKLAPWIWRIPTAGGVCYYVPMLPHQHPLFKEWLAALEVLEARRAELDTLRAELRSGKVTDIAAFSARWFPLEKATRQAGIAEEKILVQLLEACQQRPPKG